MYVLKSRVIECPIRVFEPVSLGLPSKSREQPLDEAALVRALDSIENARKQVQHANEELDRLERRWKKMTEYD